MTGPSEPEAGCLSVLSCLKKRNRARPQAPKPPIEAAASATPTLKVGKPSTTRTASDEGPASTTLHAKAHIPLRARSRVLSSASVEDKPTSLVCASGQVSATGDCPATTLDLWQEAYNEVDEKTRKWISDIPSVTNAKDPTRELVELVRCREEKYKEETLKLKVGDREILWRDYANRVVSVVTAIGDFAISFAPAPSSTVWSAVKVLLAANVSQCKDLVAIMGCTDMVLCLVRRGRVYEEVYIGESPRSTAQKDLKQRLVSVYKTCLEFLAFMDEEFKQGNLTRFLDALLNPGHGEKRVSEVKVLEQELASAAHPCDAKAGEEHRKLLQSLEGPLKRVDDNVTALLERVQRDDREKIMEYISTVPVGSYHNEKRETRTGNTCEWLINHPKFLEWENLACSSVLWLQGNIGTGKSFLSSKVIDRYCDKDTIRFPSEHDEGFAYFYCSSSDPTRQSIHSILRSYIRQLSEISRRPESVHKASYNLYKKKVKIQDDISVEDCETTLIEMFNSYPRTTLVLDALDECGKDTRWWLAELFQRFVQKSNRPLKIFIASRKEPDIEDYLASFQNPRMLIPISTSDNKGDIEKFVAAEMAKVSANWKSITPETKRLVKKVLVEESDGMFRWTYLQWAQLKEFDTNGEIKQRLGKLPKTLSGAYDEIYNRSGRERSARVMLQRAVRWILCARKPFDSCTLISAIRLESEKRDGECDIDKSDLNEQTLETVCRHLIVRDPNLGVWKFPHASVAEYFGDKEEPWVKDAQAEVTVFLINWMTDCCSNPPSDWPPADPEAGISYTGISRWFETGRADPDDTLDPRHPLQTYIHQNWLHHIQDLPDDDPKVTDVAQALKRFLGESPQQPSTEYYVFFQNILIHQRFCYPYITRSLYEKTHSAFAVVALGLHRVLDGWWDKDLNPPLMSKLLPFAIQFGDTEVCIKLISRGCDINGHAECTHQSALGISIAERKIDTIRLLLENGGNPNLIVGRHSLLCLAVEKGTEYAQLLLEKGADPNIKCSIDSSIGCWFDSALSRAGCDGNFDALKALTGKGAFVNQENLRGMYGSPLAAAAYGGNLDCARFLIEQGADANALLKWGKFGSPLAAAVYRGRLDCARLLVRHGAGVNPYLEFGEYGSVLAAAILGFYPSLDMVKFLVEEKNADLAQLNFMRPRRKDNRGRRSSEKGWTPREKIAGYLVQERQVDVQILISLGVSSTQIPSGDEYRTGIRWC